MVNQARNIDTAGSECLSWNCGDSMASLQALLGYVEDEAKKSTDWYWKNKKWKSRFSRSIQFAAVALTASGGILPIVGQLFGVSWLTSGLWASLFVGIAASLLALDKAFGFSTAWARYVLAATNIRKSLEEFRMDWAALIAKACPNPTPDQIQALIQRARDFRSTAEALVLQETKDWVNEFQNNIAQLEKDVNTQLTTLKAEAEKTAQAREAAAQPGAIELSIVNPEKADNSSVQIKLEGESGVLADEKVTGAKSWAMLNVPPGHYRLSAAATAGAKPVSAVAVVIVKPGEVSKPQITLPV